VTDRAFAERYGPWAVVAGATGGVGAAIATALAARGVGVVAVARGADALERTARRLAGDHGVPVRTVAVDLADRRAADRILDEAAGLDVGTLVYATGSSLGEGRAWEQPAEHDRMLVERNCVTPLSLARGIAPRLLARGRGAIVLLSSGAGLRGSPGVAVYSATKAFDIVLAECLWAELRPHGVDVLAPVLPFVDSESMRELMVRRGLREAGDGAPLPGALDPQDVAAEILERLGDGPTVVIGEAHRAREAEWRLLDRREAVIRKSADSGAVLALEGESRA